MPKSDNTNAEAVGAGRFITDYQMAHLRATMLEEPFNIYKHNPLQLVTSPGQPPGTSGRLIRRRLGQLVLFEECKWVGILSAKDHYVFAVIKVKNTVMGGRWLKCKVFDSLDEYIPSEVYRHALSTALTVPVSVEVISLNWQTQSKSVWAVNSCGIYACILEYKYLRNRCKHPELEAPPPNSCLRAARIFVKQFAD